MAEPPSETPRYGIGAVAKMTGLSTHILRIWERRYQAVVAERAANGRRVFSPADVEKLGLLKALTDRGAAISSIANLSLGELRERAEEMDDIQARPWRTPPRLAILGAFLPSLLDTEVAERHGLDIVACGADPTRFEAQVKRLAPDTLVLEHTVLDPAALERTQGLLGRSGARLAVIVYGFARQSDEASARELGHVLVRSPVNADQLAAAVVAAMRDGERRPVHGRPTARSASPPAVETATPPRFTPEQLLRLSRDTGSGIDCECPRHLSLLIQTLSGFEDYSQACEDRAAEDAALHARLYRQTAAARALMEAALEDVIAHDNIRL